MLAVRPLRDDWPDRLAGLVRAWREDPDIAAVYLFGSRARRQAPSPRSDVDLAVVLSPALDGESRWRKRLALTGDACFRLGTDAVDVVVLDDAPSLLGQRVLRDGRLLAEPDPRRRVEAAETVLRRYLDEAPLRAELDRALAARVKAGRFAG